MPLASELAASVTGRTKMSKYISAYQRNEDDDDETSNQNAKLTEFWAFRSAAERQAADYTSRNAGWYRSVLRLESDFDRFYDIIYRAQYPRAPAEPWDAPSSLHLFDICQSFLTFRCLNTVGQHPSGYVRIATYTTWARQLLWTAAYHIKGWGADGRNRDPTVISGRNADHSDGMWRMLVVDFVQSEAERLGLPRNFPGAEFWGPAETVLLIQYCSWKAVESPWSAPAFIQDVACQQLMLSTGIRPGVFTVNQSTLNSHNADHYVHESDVTIIQTKPGWYDLELAFNNLKGYSGPGNKHFTVKPRVPSVTKVGNLQFELQSTVIPLLIARRSLYSENPDGSWYVYSSVAEFYDSSARYFYGGAGASDGPLFRAPTNHGQLTSTCLTANVLCNRIKTVADVVHLPKARNYNFRRNAGNVARIVFGKEGQQSVLNHEQKHDAGARHYSRGVGNIPLSRVVLGEMSDDQMQARQKMFDSGHVAREADGRAVQSMLKLLRQGMRETAGREARPSKEQIEGWLQDDAQAQRALQEMARMKEAGEDDGPEYRWHQRQLSKRRTEGTRQTRKANIYERERMFKRNPPKTGAAGSLLEFQTAQRAVDALRSGLPLWLTERASCSREDLFRVDKLVALPNINDESAAICETRHEGDDDHDDLPNDFDEDSFNAEFDASTRSAAYDAMDIPSSNRIDKLRLARQAVAQHAQQRRVGDGTTGLSRGTETSPGRRDGQAGKRKRRADDDDDNEYDDNNVQDTDDDDDDELYIFDDRLEAGPLSDEADVHKLRRQLMQRTFEMLQHSGGMGDVVDFVDHSGFCPHCPMDQSGTVPIIISAPVTRRPNPFPKIQKTMIGLKATRRSVHREHLGRCHPDVLADLDRGFVPPATCDSSVKTFSPQEQTAMAAYIAKSLSLQSVIDKPDDTNAIVNFMRRAWAVGHM